MPLLVILLFKNKFLFRLYTFICRLWANIFVTVLKLYKQNTLLTLLFERNPVLDLLKICTDQHGVTLTCSGNNNIFSYSLQGHSPFWESNRFAASYEIPNILWNPHSQVTPSVPILSQLNPVHTPTPHFLQIYLNIILPSKPGSPQLSLSVRVPHQNPVHASPLLHTRYMLRPSHSTRVIIIHIFKIRYVIFSTFQYNEGTLGGNTV